MPSTFWGTSPSATAVIPAARRRRSGCPCRSPHLEALHPRWLITAAQAADRTWHQALHASDDVLAQVRPITYETAYRVAPGVALVAAPGHTPGSQIVYVQTRDGAEYMLNGDIAWHREHLERPIGHPRISAWLLNEDTPAVARQLRALHGLAAREGVILVPSHDRSLLEELADRGRLGAGFE